MSIIQNYSDSDSDLLNKKIMFNNKIPLDISVKILHPYLVIWYFSEKVIRIYQIDVEEKAIIMEKHIKLVSGNGNCTIYKDRYPIVTIPDNWNYEDITLDRIKLVITFS